MPGKANSVERNQPSLNIPQPPAAKEVEPENLLQGTFDALLAQIAVLNENGVIVSVNDAWRLFAETNNFQGKDYGLGTNYIEVCLSASGQYAEEAHLAAEGIIEVITGLRSEFHLEYSNHSPHEQRWFVMQATPFITCDMRVVVTHTNITEYKLAAEARRQEQEREFRSLERLSEPQPANVTAQMFGLSPLAQGSPPIFEQIVQKYADLLDLALHQRAYKVEDTVAGELENLAKQIGFLKAGPRDVIDIHTTALKMKTDKTNYTKAKAYTEEGRIMVLELMGYLTSFYRTYASGFYKPSHQAHPPEKPS